MVARAYAPYITPEEYLAREREAEFKSEYINGQIYAMAGASTTHVRLTGNVSRVLGNQLRGKPCEPFAQDLRVGVPETKLYTYPDVLVACPPLEYVDVHPDTILNPKVIIEVLSPSTEAYDRGAKFAHYRRSPSLTDYVLVAQDRMHLEHHERQPNGKWLLQHEAWAPDDFIEIASIDCRLTVSEVYERVVFEEAVTDRAPVDAR